MKSPEAGNALTGATACATGKPPMAPKAMVVRTGIMPQHVPIAAGDAQR